MRIRILLPVAFAMFFASFLPAQAQDSEVSLKPGDAAPKLTVGEWLKGDKVDGIEKGKVHVLEFWASWCGPCIAVIPHVSELQKKYPDVIFIGVNVWEDSAAKGVALVKKMGDKMDYRVAADKNDGMANNWLKAAGQNGIPCAFIIDEESNVAWIGHPGSMDTVLEQVIDGEFDAKAFGEKQAKIDTMMEAIRTALQDEDWDTADKNLDELLAINPPDEDQFAIFKFKMLLEKKKDADAAYKFAADFPKRFKDDANSLNEIAWFIVDEADLPRRDLDLAFKMATRGVALTKRKDGAILDTLARVHWEKGETTKAIKIQTEAVKAADDEGLKSDLEDTLRDYKKKNSL